MMFELVDESQDEDQVSSKGRGSSKYNTNLEKSKMWEDFVKGMQDSRSLTQ